MKRTDAQSHVALRSSEVETAASRAVLPSRWLLMPLSLIGKLLMKLPPFRSYLGRTAGGTMGRIARCQEHGEFGRATRIAIEALRRRRFQRSWFFSSMDHFWWWEIMQVGVASAAHDQDEGIRKELVAIAEEGLPPFEGYAAAYTFLQLSRWAWESGDHAAAVKYAEIATGADDSWADSEYLLGWYLLADADGNHETHFLRAVQRDPRVLERIVADGALDTHPELLGRIRRFAAAQRGSENLHD